MRPQDLYQVKEMVVATMAALNGDFDKEIAALKAATVEWDKRLNLAAEEKRIAALREEVNAAQQNVQAAAAAHQDRLQKMQDALVARESKVLEREKAAAVREQKLLDDSNALATAQERFQKTSEAQGADLAAKLTMAQERLDELDQRDALIVARENKVKQALAVAGTLVQ